MGCDIHAVVEYRARPAHDWRPIANEWHLEQNYALFDYLAGVRGEQPALVPPRGYPADMGIVSRAVFCYTIGDQTEHRRREVAREEVPAWCANGSVVFDHYWVSDDDLHSPTWLTGPEFLAALDTYTAHADADDLDAGWIACRAAVAALLDHRLDARVVLAFDN